MNRKLLLVLGVICLVVLVGVGVLFLYQPTQEPIQQTAQNQDVELSLLSFNIQVFGVSKIAKLEVRTALVDIISDYDISAIQEVRDSTGTSVPELMLHVPDFFTYSLGPREGRSSSKEQYLFIYNKNKFDLIATYTYPDTQDVFERNPYAAHFKSKDGFDFVVINNHISPGDAVKEISALPSVFAAVASFFGENDIIAVGDFNADGTYFKESNLATIFPSAFYTSVITNDLDTTVAEGSNTYDRMIITSFLNQDYTGQYGVLIFENMFDFTKLTIQSKEISDHYPVWAKFYGNRDTD